MRDIDAAHRRPATRGRSWPCDVYVHRLVSYIGAYIALLGGVDALTFTAGVGENDAPVRAPVP